MDVNVDNVEVDLPLPTSCDFVLLGIHWTEEEFVQQAIKARHPLALDSAIPSPLLDTVEFCVENDDATVARARVEFMTHWAKRAAQLESEEQKLKANMSASVANAVKGKRILLFKEMLQATNFPDMGVVAELQQGADLTGEVPVTNMLPGKFEPALISEKVLCANAKRLRKVAENDMRSSGDDHIDETVWTKTLEEVDKGWLVGPLDSHDVPQDRPLSRRFGLRQRKDKVRLIDDYSESGVNSCVTVVESPVLHTVDIACAVLMYWFSTCQSAGVDSLIAVRTFDLASAYRQVGLSEKGQDFAYLKVYNPSERCTGFFRSLVLPFGAVRSVHSFLRLARALWWIGVKGCRVVWTSFYDDFIAFSKPVLTGSTEKTIGLLFKLLGWVFAEEGDKAEPFSSSCSALGVFFDLVDTHKGLAYVKNTEARRDELCSDLSDVIKSGSLQSKQAQRLRGRMQFAEAQLFGRTGKRCLRVLTEFAEGRKTSLGAKDKFFLGLFLELLSANIPREVKALDCENALIFTDACYERDHETWPCGLGGVLIASDKVQFFSLPVDAHVRVLLGENYKKQIIFEAETLAAVVATILWKAELNAKRGVLFVDNEGSKFALLKGLSENTCVDLLAEFFVAVECDIHSTLWIGRVPSKSNVADPPSRGVVDTKLLAEGMNVSKLAEAVLKDLSTQMEKLGEKAAPTHSQEGCALALVDALHAVDMDRLGWWLCERQTPSGGFNGRPEKAPDVCYSWWILSALVTIDRAHWIDMEKLGDFIALAQDQDGGIADRPGDVPDVFHTFFGLAGLSLMRRADLAPIHCVYALPLEVVHRMQLPVILSMYDR
eukprot:s1151_g30.t1